MKIFDINCSIGGWPFRSVPRRSAAEVRAALEEFGLIGAAVANNGALLYSDTWPGNLELHEAITPHRDFLVGVATINPSLPQAEKELQCCVRELGFRALRLLPQYQNFQLSDPETIRLAILAGQLGVPVMISAGIVDYRQRSFLEPEAPLPLTAVLELAAKAPAANFIFLDAPLPLELAEQANLYGEFDRGGGVYREALLDVLRQVGCDKVLFGSGTPLRSTEGALLKLHHLELPEADKARLARDNAARLLRL